MSLCKGMLMISVLGTDDAPDYAGCTGCKMYATEKTRDLPHAIAQAGARAGKILPLPENLTNRSAERCVRRTARAARGADPETETAGARVGEARSLARYLQPRV